MKSVFDGACVIQNNKLVQYFGACLYMRTLYARASMINQVFYYAVIIMQVRRANIELLR